MNEAGELEKLRDIDALLQQMRAETESPAVAAALRFAIYYCHIARGFLGEDGLSPELDAELRELGVST